jgi:hypothetical protein
MIQSTCRFSNISSIAKDLPQRHQIQHYLPIKAARIKASRTVWATQSSSVSILSSTPQIQSWPIIQTTVIRFICREMRIIPFSKFTRNKVMIVHMTIKLVTTSTLTLLRQLREVAIHRLRKCHHLLVTAWMLKLRAYPLIQIIWPIPEDIYKTSKVPPKTSNQIILLHHLNTPIILLTMTSSSTQITRFNRKITTFTKKASSSRILNAKGLFMLIRHSSS